jgi:arylsulfatase A-like enzyme
MGIFSFLWNRFLSLLGTVLLVITAVALIIVYRATNSDQIDDKQRIQQKQQYLAGLENNKRARGQQPNIIFILYDDMGYGDIGVGASGLIKTPHIQQLADNGVMLSDFHSPAPVCTPARAGYLTGRLAARAGLPNVVFPTGSLEANIFQDVLRPQANTRLPAEEITLAEILRAAGYRTGMVGKWHLGDRSPSLPNDMGFESYYGALYSNDMEPFALYRNRSIHMSAPVDQTRMSEFYTDEATAFIARDNDKPFFLYLAHNFPHDPLSVRPSRSGKSDAGLYGDVLEELDDGIGQITDSLKTSGRLNNTLIIISSDNGPWYLGNAGDQRGRKGNTFEGGMRVPFIAHWPDGFSGGRVEHAMAMGTDLLPTILELLGLSAPTDRALDGKSILGVLRHGAATPHDYLYYYDGDTLFAARDQRFKYRGPAGVFYSTDQTPVGVAVPQKEWLFDLTNDTRESYDTSVRHPAKLDQLRAVFDAKVQEMRVNPRGWY